MADINLNWRLVPREKKMKARPRRWGDVRNRRSSQTQPEPRISDSSSCYSLSNLHVVIVPPATAWIERRLRDLRFGYNTERQY